MIDNRFCLQKEMPEWLRIEQEVAKLFELFGYDEVIHNNKIDGVSVMFLQNQEGEAKQISRPNVNTMKIHRPS